MEKLSGYSGNKAMIELNIVSSEMAFMMERNGIIIPKLLIGHRFMPCFGTSFENVSESESQEFHRQASVFYKEVLNIRKRYNLYPENSILTNNLGNLAIVKFNLAYPNQSFSSKLFSFSCEDEFKLKNPNFTELDNNFDNQILVMEKEIQGLDIFQSLKDSLLSEFEHKQNKFERNWDTEYKLLQYIYRLIQSRINPKDFKNVIGDITIESERSVCESCDNVIAAFRRIFPNITLIIRSYYGDEHCRYERDGIIFTGNLKSIKPIGRLIEV